MGFIYGSVFDPGAQPVRLRGVIGLKQVLKVFHQHIGVVVSLNSITINSEKQVDAGEIVINIDICS